METRYTKSTVKAIKLMDEPTKKDKAKGLTAKLPVGDIMSEKMNYKDVPCRYQVEFLERKVKKWISLTIN